MSSLWFFVILGVVTMFGGLPGTMEFKASLFASHGIAALALAYIEAHGLPNFSMDLVLELEYFEKASEMVLSHPKVDEKVGVGLIGISFSSIVLAMAVHLPCVRCVIWLNVYFIHF